MVEEESFLPISSESIALIRLGTTLGTNADGAFPPWNFNVCPIPTTSSPMSSAIESLGISTFRGSILLL